MAKKKIDLSLGSGATAQVGETTLNVNPLQGSAGASNPSIVDVGDIHLGGSASAGIDLASGNIGGGVKPQIQVGNSPLAQTGAQVGGGIGSIFGAGGAAAGSAGLSTLATLGEKIFGPGKDTLERKQRDKYLSSLQELGLFGKDKQYLLPDGTYANFDNSNTHNWKDNTKAQGKEKNRGLFSYESDYTNDLDYLGAMGGISLSRMLGGAKNKTVDQVGNLIGNQSLGSVGYGGEFNQENFDKVVTNLRSLYSKAGIQNKEDMLGLANKMFADGRVNDSDHAVMQQTASIVFDKDYNLAQSLMSNRWKGLETAAKSPAGEAAQHKGKGVMIGGKVFMPIISHEEAVASVQPLVDLYNQSRAASAKSGRNKGLEIKADIASGLSLASGLYNLGNKLSGGKLGDLIKSAAESFGGTAKDLSEDMGSLQIDAPFGINSPPPQDYQLGSPAPTVGSTNVDLSPSAPPPTDSFSFGTVP